MKIRTVVTVDINAEAWREDMMVDECNSALELRADVRSWVRTLVLMELSDRELLIRKSG